MAVQIRAIAPDEFEKMRTTMGVVFGFDPPDGDRRFLELLPLDRTRCAFDDDQLVGTAGAFSLNMTVPGGEVPCGGTTIVAVAPTHRRQGILRAMMRSHLDDVKERGEPIAGLWASDSAIYGRFGYGCASVCYDMEIDVEHGEWSRLAPEPDRVRLVERAEAMTLAPPLYDRIRAEVPGFFERTTAWWEDRSFRDSESAREGSTSLRYAVVDDDGGITGLATFRTRSRWDGGHGVGKVVVKDLFATHSRSVVRSLVADRESGSRVQGGSESPPTVGPDLRPAGRNAASLGLPLRRPMGPIDGGTDCPHGTRIFGAGRCRHRGDRPARRHFRLVPAPRRHRDDRMQRHKRRAVSDAGSRRPERGVHGTAPVPADGPIRPGHRRCRRSCRARPSVHLGPATLVPRDLLRQHEGPSADGPSAYALRGSQDVRHETRPCGPHLKCRSRGGTRRDAAGVGPDRSRARPCSRSRLRSAPGRTPRPGAGTRGRPSAHRGPR